MVAVSSAEYIAGFMRTLAIYSLASNGTAVICKFIIVVDLNLFQTS